MSKVLVSGRWTRAQEILHVPLTLLLACVGGISLMTESAVETREQCLWKSLPKQGLFLPLLPASGPCFEKSYV